VTKQVYPESPPPPYVDLVGLPVENNLEKQHSLFEPKRNKNTLQNNGLSDLIDRARERKEKIKANFSDLLSGLEVNSKEAVIWALSHENDGVLNDLYAQRDELGNYDIRKNAPTELDELTLGLRALVRGENPFSAAMKLKLFLNQLIMENREQRPETHYSEL
jgi:hypothetical protein